jgi:hypothetical protein
MVFGVDCLQVKGGEILRGCKETENTRKTTVFLTGWASPDAVRIVSIKSLQSQLICIRLNQFAPSLNQFASAGTYSLN